LAESISYVQNQSIQPVFIGSRIALSRETKLQQTRNWYWH